jgi:hypothetical protein
MITDVILNECPLCTAMVKVILPRFPEQELTP